MPYTIALVAALSIFEIFIPDSALDLKTPLRDADVIFTTADRLAEDERSSLRKAYNATHHSFTNLDARSDALKLLSALLSYSASTEPSVFCAKNFMRSKALHESHLLRNQLTKLLYSNGHIPSPALPSKIPFPSPTQIQALKQMVAAGFIDHVAIRADLAPIPPSTLRKNPRSATDVPYLPLFPASSTLPFRSFLTPEQDHTQKDSHGVVYIHPSSVLSQLAPSSMPSYIIYSHLSLSSPSSTSTSTSRKPPRIRLHPLTPISGAQLAALAHGTPLLEYGKPVTGKGMIMPQALPPLTQGHGRNEERRECWVVPYLRGEGSAAGAAGGLGSQGWPLPAKKVVQRRVKGKGWVVE